jgi:hypothetical protein
MDIIMNTAAEVVWVEWDMVMVIMNMTVAAVHSLICIHIQECSPITITNTDTNVIFNSGQINQKP